VEVSGPWQDDGRIPKAYTCDGSGRKPRIVARTPGRAKDAAIVMTDPDAPGGTFVHWTSWDGATEGTNSFGKRGYGPPCPPKGDRPHRYVITVYALRRPLDLAAGSPPAKVVAGIRRLAFASGSLIGLYGR